MKMNDLIKQAIEKYEAYEAECEAQAKARELADQMEAEKEVEEMRQFLATLMPEELVQYANLDGYRHRYARQFRSDESNGVVVWVQPPSCFPIRVRVYHDGDKLCHEPDRWSRSGPEYNVPTLASVQVDKFGDEGYYIRFDGSENFGDFTTALGYAAVRGADLIGLQKEIEERKASDKINDEYARQAEGGLREMQEKRTPQERIAAALENIADGVAALHLYN